MLVLAASPELDRHDTGTYHPERRSRVLAALDGLAEAGLSDAVVNLEPRRATMEELELVHPRVHLDEIKAFCEAGGGALDPDTIASPGSWDTALIACGSALSAVETLASGGGEFAFVCERPPGHHATSNRAMGFCLVNNIAVAASTLAMQGERVLIVDWDVHHGNGTQDIFWDDPRVMYVSTHQWPLYPGTGRPDETGGPKAPGLTMNIPLPAGTTGDVVLSALDEVAAPAVESFDPTWILVSAGYDAHRADPLAGLSLTSGDFADIAARVRALGTGRTKMVLLLEGGYDLDALRASVGATFSTLLGGSFRPEPSSSNGPGRDVVDRLRALRA